MSSFTTRTNDTPLTSSALVSANSLSAAMSALQVTHDDALRIPYYCEENVWRLAYRKLHTTNNTKDDNDDKWEYFVVFISNANKSVPMFQQKATKGNELSVCWDYHVILLAVLQNEDTTNETDDKLPPVVLVYDMDSKLDYPSPLAIYLAESFPFQYKQIYTPYFRIIPAALYCKHFASNRMHMFNTQTNTWNHPPPSYQCIVPTTTPTNNNQPMDATEIPNNLNEYLDFSDCDTTNPSEPSYTLDYYLKTVFSMEQLEAFDFMTAAKALKESDS